MKKTYFIPETKVINVETNAILAGSIGLNNEISTYRSLGKQSFDDDWDEEDY